MESVEQIKRWYSMGMIRVADFDGDGDVDIADRNLADYVINVRATVPVGEVTVFATGDINQVDGVTSADWTLWLAHWNDIISGTNQLPQFLNYYGPNDL
jgi:hypothetical protein